MTRREQLLRHYAEQREATDRRVAEGIEKNRKGNAALKFVDGSGKPVTGIRVKATLKKHAFLHGANLYELNQTESAEKNAAYREKFKEVFNAATVPIYWAPLEPEQGKPRYAKDSSFIYRRPPIDLCLEYCEEAGIRPKAHCLNYFQRAHYPAWMPEAVEEAKPLIEKHFADLAQHYRDRIPDWEVINETLGSYILRDSNPPIFFMPDSIEWSFALAEKYFPANRLLINEDPPNVWGDTRGDRRAYYLQIERALARGARIDLIGLQGHMIYEQWNPALQDIMCNPAMMFETLDQYTQFGLPIQITEVSVPAMSDSAEDEALQAEWLRELYPIWFSHPAVEAAIYWDLPDGYAPGAQLGAMEEGWNVFRSGLLRFDMSEKPAFKELKRLFCEEWHTEESFTADENGCGGFRGFYGTYTLELEAGAKTVVREVSFTKNTEGEIVVTV